MTTIQTSLRVILILSLLLGIAYPLAMTGAARLLFSKRANGSLVLVDGRAAGSELVGQNFSNPEYFHGRPSASNYDALNSGGSNFGPTNKKLIDDAARRAGEVRKVNGLPADALVPADLVLASGSGLDPQITEEGALIQAARVARQRKIDEASVIALVKKNAEPEYFGIYGKKIVNVLKLNLDLDRMGKEHGR